MWGEVMCYTGKCRYEGYMGNPCCFEIRAIPHDAFCVVIEEEIEKIEKIIREKQDGYYSKST